MKQRNIVFITSLLLLPVICHGSQTTTMPPFHSHDPKFDQHAQFDANRQVLKKEPTTVGGRFDAKLPPPNSLPLTSLDDVKTVEPGKILVMSPDLSTAKKNANKLRRLGLTLKHHQELTGLDIVLTTLYLATNNASNKEASGLSPKETLQLVQRKYPDMYIGVNHRYQLLNNPNAIKRFAQQSLQWDKVSKNCGTGIRIGLLDTLVNTNHPALKNRKIQIHNVSDNKVMPTQSSHGTAIAGILVGNPDTPEFTGLLPNAELIAVNVFRENNDKNIDTNTETVIRGLNYLANLEPKVSVINMSFGGSYNMLLELATHRALQHDIVIVAAAGNSGPDGKPVYPAALHTVLATTAIDTNQSIYEKANQGAYIDYAAPGVDIWTATNNLKGQFVSGTSYAAPFMTALFAYAKYQSPELNLIELQNKLANNIRDLGKKGRDPIFGRGLMQLPNNCQ